MRFSSRLIVDPPQARLVASGELDAFAVLPLRRSSDQALVRGCRDVVVDLEQVTFVDAGGLRALDALRSAVVDNGGQVVFAAPSRSLRWVAGLAGIAAAFGLDLPEGPGGSGALVPAPG